MAVKLLVVDDEKDILEFLKYNLEANNYIVETAQDGVSALKKLKTYKPSLVILDVMMPRLNGVETCEEIRKDPAFNDVVILFYLLGMKSLLRLHVMMLVQMTLLKNQ